MAHQRKIFKGTTQCACACGMRRNPRRRFAPGHSWDFKTRQLHKLPERGRPVAPRNAWTPDPNVMYVGVIDTVCSGFYFAALSQGRCFIAGRIAGQPLQIGDKVSVKVRLGREAATRQGARWAATECRIQAVQED